MTNLRERELEARTELVRCPACDGDRAEVYREHAYRIGKTAFRLVRCECGMVFVNPRPDGATMARMYDDAAYYTEGYNLGVETDNYFERKEELLELYDREIQRIERETGGKGALLELGSAGGFLLEAARRRGFEVHGVELSPVAAEYSRREMRLEVFQGLLEHAPFPAGTFNVAIADNVLEHTQSPQGVLGKLFRLLRPGGSLVVIVPSYVNSPYYRALLKAQRMLPKEFLGERLLRILKFDPESDGGYPYHILEFDRRTLSAMLRRVGFEIRGVEASLPLPAHLFKAQSLRPRDKVLRAVFRTMNGLMRAKLLPGGRIRIVARKPESGRQRS